MALKDEQVDDLLYAARTGDVDAFKEALHSINMSEDADFHVALRCTNEAGNSVLHYAFANGHEDLIHYVLPHCDLTALLRQNEAGNTPLHWAAFNGHMKLCELLIDRIDALETQDTSAAKALRVEEDKREHERHMAANKDTGESEAEQKAELEHHDELQRERALWDVRNAAGHGPMTEAQKADREDIVQMMLGRLAKQDRSDSPPLIRDEAPHVEELTNHVFLDVNPTE